MKEDILNDGVSVEGCEGPDDERCRLTYEDSIGVILEKVSWATQVPVEDICGKMRRDRVVMPRHLYCYFARQIWGTTVKDSEIAEVVGTTRSNVAHSVKKVKDLLETGDMEYCSWYRRLKPAEKEVKSKRLLNCITFVSALAELQTHCLTRARDIAGEGYYEQMMITSLKDLSDTLKASLQRESGLKAETVDLEKLLDGLMKETLSGRELKRLGHEQGGS